MISYLQRKLLELVLFPLPVLVLKLLGLELLLLELLLLELLLLELPAILLLPDFSIFECGTFPLLRSSSFHNTFLSACRTLLIDVLLFRKRSSGLVLRRLLCVRGPKGNGCLSNNLHLKQMGRRQSLLSFLPLGLHFLLLANAVLLCTSSMA